MQRSCAEPPPQCAFNPQEQQAARPKDDTRGRRNPPPMHRANKGEPQPMSGWPPPTFENSNTSWEGDWSNASSSTPPIKTEPGYYGNRIHYADWSPEDSSSSTYGQHSSQHYYESSNGFYGYNNYGYQQYPGQPPQQQQQQQQQYGQLEVGPPYSGGVQQRNHIPSSGYPHKMGGFEYQKKQMLMRYPAAEPGKMQIKREPDDSMELDSENFTSLFTKSLTSLYSQDTENAFPDDSNNTSTNNGNTVNNIKSYEQPPPHQMTLHVPTIEEPSTYQRLSNPGSHYGAADNPVSTFQDVGRSSSNSGYYGRTPENPDPGLSNVVEELGTNPEGYQKPFFDTMHQFTPNESKNPAKKRKINIPTMSPENSYLTPESSNSRKKTPRLTPSYPSESQWTPNSFAFSDIQIKQEPMDDYNSPSDISLQSSGGVPFKESNSPNSNGTAGNGSKSPDHPKPPPRKRSPATCFDRFDKKSTPTNKKVSPLSVYAKVQENVVLSVKCRRYKKRTKPITGKEESVCPGREEMELYKQNSLTPDQAARQVVGDLLERVELFEERSVIDGPNLSQLDAMKVRELLMQFCHRYVLDYQDFEDINAVLRPRITSDDASSSSKNSDRASAIRKRTSTISTSNVQAEVEQQPQPAKKPSSRAEKKNEAKPSPRVVLEPKEIGRVLRSLPGRPKVNREELDVSPRRSYSTRSSKDTDSVKEVSLVVSSSTSSDSESEAGREAEVRKKTQRRLKKRKKMPAAEVVTPPTPARNNRSRTTNSPTKNSNPVESGICTRSREAIKTKGQSPKKSSPSRLNLRSRRDVDSKKASSSQPATRSSSVEILEVKTEKSSVDDAIETVIAKSGEEKVKNERVSRRTASPKKSQRVKEKSPVINKKNLRSSTRSSTRLDSFFREKIKLEEWESIWKALDEPEEKPRITRRRSCRSSEPPKTPVCEMEISRKDLKAPKDCPKKSNQKNSPKVSSDKCSAKSSPASDKSELNKSKRVLRKCSSQNNIYQNSSSDTEHKSDFNSKKSIGNRKTDLSANANTEMLSKSPKLTKIIKEEIISDDSADKPKVTEKTSNVKLSPSSSKSPKSRNNSKVLVVDDSCEDSVNPVLKTPTTIAQVPFASKSSKQITKHFTTSSDSSIESDEPLQVLKDRKKQVKVKTRSMRSKKSFLKDIGDFSEELKVRTRKGKAKPLEDCSEKSNDKSKSPIEKAKKSKVEVSLKAIKSDQETATSGKETQEVTKTLTGSRRRKATVKSEKFIKKEKIDFTEKMVLVPNSSEVVPVVSSEKSTAPMNSEVSPSKAESLQRVDDLVAAVSSLVESETKSEKENEEKTLAAHSLLELGNSALFAKVGSVPTSKPEIIDLTLSSSDSPTLFKENFGEPGLELLHPGECNIKSFLIHQPLPFCNPTSYDKPVANSPITYSKNPEKYEKQVAVNTPYIYKNSEKPVTFNSSYMFNNKKLIAVNTPYIFRNGDKYEKQVAVNTPYIHRNSEKYEKPVAINTPHIFRNSDKYEKQVAVNTPYIHRNGESQEKAASSSSLMKNSSKRRIGKDKRVQRVEISSQGDKPISAIKDNDLNNNLNKSNQVELSANSVSNVSTSVKIKATHHSSKTFDGECVVEPSTKHDGNEIKSQVTNPKSFNTKESFQKNHSFSNHHQPQIIQVKPSQNHSKSSDPTKVLNLCNIPEKKTILGEHSVERLKKFAVEDKPLSLKSVKVVKGSSRSMPCIPLEDTSDDQPMNLSRAGPSSVRKVTPSGLIKRCAPRLRSESEDSDGKLVIDLDRRSSLDDRALCSPPVSPAPDTDITVVEVAPPEPSRPSYRSAEENEAGRTLLELTRAMVPAGSGEDFSSAELEERRQGERDESILRTLLLESGAIGHRTSQDRSQNGSDSSSSMSSTSKNPLTRFLMMCKTGDEDTSKFSSSESTSIDGKKFSLGRHILV